MIHATPDWWNPRIRVGGGTETWTVEPEDPPRGFWNRVVHPPWKQNWVIRTRGRPAEGIGVVRVTVGAANEMFVTLGNDAVSIPHRQASRDFVWQGRTYRFVALLTRLERDGVEVARFHCRGNSVLADGYPSDLERFVSALAAAQVLLRLCTPNPAAG
jgi:hypothetical protein